jgi:hypothetical protein
MTTKTEMTLENVCFKHDLREASEKAIEVGNKKYGANHKGEFECFYWVDKGKFFGHYDNFKRRKLIAPSDYLLLLSAPESQAHLLTEKHSNDMAHVSEHKSAMEYLKEPSLKELSRPPVMEGREEKITYQTTLTDKELINLCDEWVSKMCKTGGKAFTMSVPVRLNYDTDVVLSALINRFSLANKTIQSLQSEVEQLKGLLKEAQPFCGTMLRGKIEHYTSK